MKLFIYMIVYNNLNRVICGHEFKSSVYGTIIAYIGAYL
jgi:hypothetical protein